ncbi:unnamed protein product, partial [Iphiclides podalirius]
MSQRRLDTTIWLWYVLIISGPAMKSVRCVKVLTPPKNPATVEAQAKFFQDFFSVQLSPYKIEFGHVCEDPNTWEQRYERKDYKNHRDMGKVRWGDKKGGYGEHYWDLNHAGHAGNHGDDGYDSSDDGSYHDEDGKDSYYEPSEQSHNYRSDEYDPEAEAKYEESGRAKRAHSKVKRQQRKENTEQQSTQRPFKQTKNKEQTQTVPENYETDESSEEERPQEYTNQKQRTSKQQQTARENSRDRPEQAREKNQIVLVVGHKERETQEPNNHQARQLEDKLYVPYEGGAGIRQHQHPERQVTAAANAPRLFLEPTTGHVVDRATGQAYVLQPLIKNPNYR